MPLTDRLDEAFGSTPRRDFLPRSQRRHAALDQPLEIGWGATCSQPSCVRLMLELLDPAVGDSVLDVGSGSGWTTALLAALVGPSGSVTGVEMVPDLVVRGAAAVSATGRPWAVVEAAEPDVLGKPAGAPYDRVLVSAEPQVLPEELVAQLGPGGVLVGPVAGRMTRVSVALDGRCTVETLWHCRFVPLLR